MIELFLMAVLLVVGIIGLMLWFFFSRRGE
jgi:hypothetical protein